MSLLQVLGLPVPPAAGRAAAGAATADAGVKAAAAATSRAKTERLTQAATSWRDTHRLADQRIDALKKAIQAHYAGRHPALLQEIEKGVGKLDRVLDNVDHSLADVMASAGKADDAARKTELASAKALLTTYITYLTTEPLIAHMDTNPFGVKTGLQVLLATGLREAARAIG